MEGTSFSLIQREAKEKTAHLRDIRNYGHIFRPPPRPSTPNLPSRIRRPQAEHAHPAVLLDMSCSRPGACADRFGQTAGRTGPGNS